MKQSASPEQGGDADCDEEAAGKFQAMAAEKDSNRPIPKSLYIGATEAVAWAWEAAAGPGEEDPFHEDWAAARARL